MASESKDFFFDWLQFKASKDGKVRFIIGGYNCRVFIRCNYSKLQYLTKTTYVFIRNPNYLHYLIKATLACFYQKSQLGNSFEYDKEVYECFG